MRTTLISFSLFLSIFFLVQACTDQENSPSEEVTQKPLNPNGDSELALLMRAMFEEAEQMGRDIRQGRQPVVKLDHEKILTAEATEPEKVASDQYKIFAKSYLQSLEELQTAPVAARHTMYDNLVNNCMVCHQAICPGPIARITKLQ